MVAVSESRTEEGFTLIELLVTTAIMALVAVMVLVSLVNVMTQQNEAASLDRTSSQVGLAFIALDKEVRYAATIDCPYGWTSASAGPCSSAPSDASSVPSGDYALTFYSTYTTATLGHPQCTELLYDTAKGLLEQRTWNATGSVSGASGWSIIGSGLSTSPSEAVFTVPDAASGSIVRQQVTVSLASSSAGTSPAVSSTAQVTFTAVNSIAATPPTSSACPLS
jgi:prepilin-type N-terminal cleavage/methylation domain-containing protein